MYRWTYPPRRNFHRIGPLTESRRTPYRVETIPAASSIASAWRGPARPFVPGCIGSHAEAGRAAKAGSLLHYRRTIVWHSEPLRSMLLVSSQM